MDTKRPWNWLRGLWGGDEGFTLLEVLIALSVLSTSLAVLLAIFSQGLDRTRQDETRMAARALSQSLLAQATTTSISNLRSVFGQTDRFSWSIRLSPYASVRDSEALMLSPAIISIEVTWDDHGRNRNVTLSTIRLLPKGGV